MEPVKKAKEMLFGLFNDKQYSNKIKSDENKPNQQSFSANKTIIKIIDNEIKEMEKQPLHSLFL